jgi:hypothetical protein
MNSRSTAVNEPTYACCGGRSQHIHRAFDVHTIEVRLVGIRFAERGCEVTHAVSAAHRFCERMRMQNVTAMQYRTAMGQLIDQRLLPGRFRTT